MCGKMAEELLSLKWNNHQAHFVDILTFLREQEIFVDATLACGGKLYAAHKFVLSTCSDYFKQMFTRSPSKHPIVYMKDVTARDLEALLDFMYNGEVNVPQSSLGSLIKTAEGLQIKGLAVPDDPPAPKRERDREKDRDHKVHLEHSPPAKRLRPRERSPPHSTAPSLPQTPSVPRSRSPPHPPTPSGASQVSMPPVEATLDEDSRTSVHSANSNLSEVNSAPSLSSKQQASSSGDTTPHQDQLPSNPTEEPSPGPSGIQNPPQSKEEPEVDIKQEDVVDLGEEDEGDWNLEGDGGGGDSSLGGSENPNFPEVMLPHTTDGSVPTSGDPAMTMRLVLGELGEAGGGAPPVDGGNSSYPLWHNPPSTTTTATTSASSTAVAAAAAAAAAAVFTTAAAAVEGETVGSSVPAPPPPPELDILEYCLNDAVGDQLPGEPKSPRLTTTTTAGGSGTSSSSGGDQSVVAGALLYQCRPFACRYCAKRFKRKDHLVEHERTHTGERPYVCSVCGKSFAKKTNLNTHSRSHHQQQQQQFCHLHAS